MKLKSLSDYFGSSYYFYGYPSGATADFYNLVPAHIEELVAARALKCAGPLVKPLSFWSTSAASINPEILKRLQLVPDGGKGLVFPKELDAKLTGEARNEAIISYLETTCAPQSFLMAQPFNDARLTNLYAIKPETTLWLNDKDNLTSYISEELLPAKYATYKTGQQFAENSQHLPLPCVVKVTSSSSGDGVFLCREQEELEHAVVMLKESNATILVEQLVEATHNYGIQFGIPHDAKRPIDIIGVAHQITTESGEFLGGIIESTEIPKRVSEISKVLIEKILPKAREMGWYGVGCYDVLVDKAGKCYIIDCNFRMTGMTAALFMAQNGQITTPILSFGGSIDCDEAYFTEKIVPLFESADSTLSAIALSRNGTTWRFNCLMNHTDNRDILKQAEEIHRTGITSRTLDRMTEYIHKHESELVNSH